MEHYPIIYGRLGNPSAGAMAGAKGEYVDYVKKWSKKHPEYTWRQAMKKASKSYHEKKGGDWPGDKEGHREAALKGWEERKGKKPKEKSSTKGKIAYARKMLRKAEEEGDDLKAVKYQERLDMLGGVYAAGEPPYVVPMHDPSAEYYRMMMLKSLEGSGKESKAQRKKAAMLGWEHHYEHAHKPEKAKEEKKKMMMMAGVLAGLESSDEMERAHAIGSLKGWIKRHEKGKYKSPAKAKAEKARLKSLLM